MKESHKSFVIFSVCFPVLSRYMLHQATMSSFNLETKLYNLYTTLQNLSSSSSDAEFKKFGAFFASGGKAYLKNMREHDQPAQGRENIIQKLKEIMTEKHWQIVDRQVLSSCVTSDGSRVFCETRKRLLVCGKPVDPFYETEVAMFDAQGFIEELRLYSCWSPIASVIQQVTGKGPYAVADYKATPED